MLYLRFQDSTESVDGELGFEGGQDIGDSKMRSARTQKKRAGSREVYLRKWPIVRKKSNAKGKTDMKTLVIRILRS
jgi:hypothetical protein